MTGDFVWQEQEFAVDIAHGYLRTGESPPGRRNPKLVYNQDDNIALRVIREELSQCDSFLFSVAFITASGISLILTDLLETQGSGTIVTSDYLSFNSPTAFAELQKMQSLGIDVRIHSASAFHPKGYIFRHGESFTTMIGSSNLTSTALVRNHEWNLRVSATRGSDLGRQLKSLWAEQLVESQPLSQEWIDGYASRYTPPAHVMFPRQPGPLQSPNDAGPLGFLLDQAGDTTLGEARILPNRMQREALQAIQSHRQAGAPRALIISATGTGKTILSALDVRAVDPKRVLFVVHREQIIARSIEEFSQVLGLPITDFGRLAGPRRELERRHVFAMVQTLSRPEVLASIDPTTFDYIIIDEAHRAGTDSYHRVLNHFTPHWWLGMTATPERTDGFDVYALFDHVVPYEIRLQHALEEEMLTPFHYFGVADLTFDDGSTTTDATPLARLVAPERVRHLLRAIETYGQAGVPPRGLIFCSRREEAHQLSEALNGEVCNGRLLRTVALTGSDSHETRTEAVRRLEEGHLDYLLTVDIFNEGIDIPIINQVIMLRQTESAIVFVQQLGRGLRRAPDKEYVVVIDMIGNYSNNFLIPIALFGDNSLDKESLRKNLIAAEELGVVAGVSSVRFDQIAQSRVMAAITSVKLDSMKRLAEAILTMKQRVGRAPRLMDFWRIESADPVVLATKERHYPSLLTRVLGIPLGLTPDESRMLWILSAEILTAKRPHEAIVTTALIEAAGGMSVDDIDQVLRAALGPGADSMATSAIDTLTLTQHAEADQRKYGTPLAAYGRDDHVRLDPSFIDRMNTSGVFRGHVLDLLETNQAMVKNLYPQLPFTSGRQYGRKEVCRLLGWPRKWSSTLYGYRSDIASGTCPIFVTLHKDSDVSATTQYEDALIDQSTMRWFTRSRRTLESGEVAAIVQGTVVPHIFVKKDDAEGTSFYYLGSATPSRAEETTIPDGTGGEVAIVSMLLHFAEPIPSALYDYYHPIVTAEPGERAMEPSRSASDV